MKKQIEAYRRIVEAAAVLVDNGQETDARDLLQTSLDIVFRSAAAPGAV